MPTVNRKAPVEPHLQTIVFERAAWTEERARAWLKENGHRADGMHETETELRFRQFDPERSRFGYAPIKVRRGIRAIRGTPAKRSKDFAAATPGGSMAYKTSRDEATGLYTIHEFEVCAIGTWHGINTPPEGMTFTEQEFQQILAADKSIRKFMAPTVKFGHTDRRSGIKGKLVGYMGEIKRKGEKLVADLMRLPESAFQAIVSGMAGRQSPEFYANFTEPATNTFHPLVQKGVAFVEGEMPAMTSLRPAFEFEADCDTITLTDLRTELAHQDGRPQGQNNGNGGNDMEAAQLAAAENDLRARERAFDEKERQFAAKAEKLKEQEEAIKTAETALAKGRDALKARKIDFHWKTLSGQVPGAPQYLKPESEKGFKELCMRMDDAQTFEFAMGDGQSASGSALDQYLATYPEGRTPIKPLKTRATTTTGDGGGGDDEDDDKLSATERVFQMADELQEKHKISRGEALGIVERKHPELVKEHRKAAFPRRNGPPDGED